MAWFVEHVISVQYNNSKRVGRHRIKVFPFGSGSLHAPASHQGLALVS
ncbi:hypothetical protein SLEP1_g18505 [Rubroshorea leprosula]|uniref:Uncharacterized protein n=1 Tax=Rubroshorea leprosula TaxID=152421 RepID=A0AAV5J5C4_9ROSI|nr:hypothetical protein SLEP1_g18505 [Rubroshorea leprosula]